MNVMRAEAFRVKRITGRRLRRVSIVNQSTARQFGHRVRNGRNQPPGIRVGWIRENPIPRTTFDNLPEIHDRHPVAHMLHDAQVVADHDVGKAKPLLQLQEQIDDLRPDRDIKGRNGLIEHDDFRIK